MQQYNIAKILANVVIGIGVIVIIGWFFDIQVLKNLFPSLVTMKLSTAISFVMSGIIIYLINEITQKDSIFAKLFLPAPIIVIIFFMVTLFVSNPFGIQTGIEDVFIKETEAVKSVTPGRPSIGTMVSFILVIIASLTFIIKSQKNKLFFIIGNIIVAISSLSLIGYVTDLSFLYYEIEKQSTAMALHTSIAFVVTGISIILLSKHTLMQQHSRKLMSIRKKIAIIIFTGTLPVILFTTAIEYYAHQDINFVLPALVAITAFAIIATIFISKLIITPIMDLTKYIENFDVDRIEPILEYENLNHQRDDEISKLYHKFKSMTDSIRKSTSALKLAEQKYRSLYDDLPDLCRTINRDGIILDCNKIYAKSLGHAKEKIIGRSIFEHTPKDSIKDLRKSFETWRKSGSVSNREVKLKRKDGTNFPVLISATNLYDANDHLVGSNTLIKDISEIHTLLEVDKAKDEFSSMVSHELKTPLIPIMGYCEMLKDPKFFGKLTAAQLESINEIYDNASRLNNLINEVLTAQKLELNKLSFTKEIFDVGEFLELVTKNHSSLMIQKQITFINSYDSNEKVVIKSDKNRLLEVFTNLIQNAVDFVLEQNGRIEIGAINNDKVVHFYVKDNGVGIPSDKIDKLFTKFYQIDTSFSRKHGGSGLGLVICKGIVSSLAGDIKVESNVGTGTTFSFAIPKGDDNK